MIATIRGTITELGNRYAVVDINGVGYKVFVTNDAVHVLKIGTEISFWTHMAVREDAQDLYGFTSKKERDFFQLLITVSGIGPKSALNILSLVSNETLSGAIRTGSVAHLVKVSGIGKKTAEKIVLELKDKLGVAAEWEASSAKNAPSEADVRMHDAVLALISLGYKQVEAHKAVRRVLDLSESAPSAEELIRQALKILS